MNIAFSIAQYWQERAYKAEGERDRLEALLREARNREWTGMLFAYDDGDDAQEMWRADKEFYARIDAVLGEEI